MSSHNQPPIVPKKDIQTSNQPAQENPASSTAPNRTRSIKDVNNLLVSPIIRLGSPRTFSNTIISSEGPAFQSGNNGLEIQDYVTNKIELMKRTQAGIRKCTQLAGFIPDYILTEEMTRKIPYQSSKEAVVVMADVSGFTALTEAYSLKGKGGTDQLTKTLMNYIGPLAECILVSEGDIVKYAGDAFLAFWPSTPDDFPEDVQRVVDCALYMQEKYGSYYCKDVDITIKVKFGIGAGTIHLCWIGNESYQHYVCFGPGVEGASEGERHCTSGEVVLHPSTLQYCSASNYKFTKRDDDYRVVTDILTFLNPQKRGRPMKSRRSVEKRTTFFDESVRPKIAQSVEVKSEEFMRRFVIPPVLKKLDDEIPLEYINESRSVSICFIHIETENMSHDGAVFRDTMTKIVNKAFVKIHSLVSKMQGALTKVIMFDKGLTYLVVFGLPGYTNENQSTHALKFSDQAKRSLMSLPFIQEVSIGVTTGQCYCGVLGHPRRQEYTVIGRKVNKAARLMCYYPGKVTCDQDTAYHSKLPMENFELQEFKVLKGIANPGKIYEYMNKDTFESQSVTSSRYPILGRDPELRYFKDVLLKAQREFSDHLKVTTMSNPTGTISSGLAKETAVAKGIWMIVFEGEIGIGKTRTLSACIAEAERQNVKVFSVAMNLILSGQSLFGLSSLVMDAIGISDLRTFQEREDYLRKRITDADLASELCVLNDVIHTKFPLNPKYQSLDVTATHVYGQHVLSTLLRALYPSEQIMLVIDDSHLLDTLSWEYIVYLARTPYVFTVCTLRRNAAGSPRLADAVTRMVYHNKNIKTIRLNGLDIKNCLGLACQLMEVIAIPQDVEKILMAKSQGVPAWCEQVLNELVRGGVLRVTPYMSSWKKQIMAVAEENLVRKQAILKKQVKVGWLVKNDSSEDILSIKDSVTSTTNNRGSIAGFGKVVEVVEVDPSKRMLVVKSDTNIAHIPLSGTLHEILLDSYDELNSTEQIILKGAAILGRKFSRQMLTKVLTSEIDYRKQEVGFHHLMESRYIRCASGISKNIGKDTINVTPDCFCKPDPMDASFYTEFEQVGNAPSGIISRPKYWSCKFMEFVKENLVEVVYDLMTEDQKKKFHLRAAKYIDDTSLRCESCGGGNTTFTFGITVKTGDLGIIDNDEMRMGNSRRKSAPPNKGEGDQENNITGNRRTSITTQLQGAKKVFLKNVSKVGQIDLDILRTMRHLEEETQSKFCASKCCKKTKPSEHDDAIELELHTLRDPEDRNIVNLKTSEDKDVEHTDGQPNESGDNTDTDRPIDLRMCECAALQAKLCIEMVKHYRAAQKFGKCMTNLLEAAESVITVGNGTQALIHLEDATGLLHAIKKGDYPSPSPDDPDDAKIDDVKVDGQIEYLSGLAYFEIGVYTKARDYFVRALGRLGIDINQDESRMIKGGSIIRAKTRLWRSHHFQCCKKKPKAKNNNRFQMEDEAWSKKIRILAYLHVLFKQDKKMELALLVTLWEVITAEQYGDIILDVIPAYCNMMEMYAALSQHSKAQQYEVLALKTIRPAFKTNEELEPILVLTAANLFLTISSIRLFRGSIQSSSVSSYLALRKAQMLHDNALLVRILPVLCISLLMSLRITEVVEALQKLWYTAEEENDWCGIAMYYKMCLELLINTAYPLESFGTIESFVINNDWESESNLYRDYDLQYSMESSIALWYTRYSRWESAMKWIAEAETHKPKVLTFMTVSAELKLLECHLIFVEHYLDSKHYQHFAKSRNNAKVIMRSLTKSTKLIPFLKPRFLHLLAYYYRIRSRNLDSDKQMKAAQKLAIKHGNKLEQEWLIHNRTVWNEMAIPTIKYFWLEHTETHTLDWHQCKSIPWANIMYSLPIPAWKG